MKISMILSTLGRDYDIISFIESLEFNNNAIVKIYIIDQNNDQRVNNVLSKYIKKNEQIELFHYKVNFKGLSKARNYGLKLIDSDTDILCFPDDDCKYLTNTLDSVIEIFSKKNYDFISGVSLDEYNHNITLKSNKDIPINRIYNIFGKAISYTIFINYQKYKNTNIIFDERLGVGAEFGSTEETDFLFNLIKSGLVGYNVSVVEVYHPNKDLNIINLDRLYYYGLGVGAFTKKHSVISLDYIFFFVKSILLAPSVRIIKSIFTLNFPLFKVGITMLKARLLGFVKY
ncbi:glycosyltransferase [Providencia rettgeri]